MQSFFDVRRRKLYTGVKRGGKVLNSMTLNILNTAAGMILLMAVGFLCGKLGFIPCETHGLNFSVFPDVYPMGDVAIEAMTKEMFG